MSETAELAAALAAVQAELPEVGKNRTADVANKEGRKLYSYSYADLADVSAAVLPVLGKHGLAFAAFPGHQADGKFGLRYYLLHSSGGSLEGFFEIDDKGGMQLVGGRITYARRYCLCAVTGITADEDVDAREDGGSRTVQRKQRAQTSPPAKAAAPPVPAAAPEPMPGAGGDLPPLPGEAGHDTPGTATSGPHGQLTAIWTVLGTVYHFDKDEKDQARGVCAQILNVTLKSSTDLSYNQARTVLDTLARWQKQAEERGDNPRAYLLERLEAAKTVREEAPSE